MFELNRSLAMGLVRVSVMVARSMGEYPSFAEEVPAGWRRGDVLRAGCIVVSA